MRTFVVQLRGGERLRLRANHLYHREATVEVVAWDEEVGENRAIALFPIADVAMIYAEEALIDGLSSRKPEGLGFGDDEV